MFLHIPRAHEQGQIGIYGFMSKICLESRLLRFYNHTRVVKKPKNNRFRFLSSLQLTALLLKSFRLRFQCYTLP